MKYIDAEKLRALLVKRYNAFQIGQHSPFRNGKVESLRETIELIDSLQQEQPEVELEKEIDRFWDSCIKHKNERDGNVIWSNKIEIEVLARHFYELGLNARKLF